MANATKLAKPVRRTQAERTALSDSRMFEAAMQLICETGTHNTTLKEVGERAGYSRGLASNRFGSKEALFSQLVHSFNEKWAEELDRFVGNRTGLSALMAALDAVEDVLINQPTDMKAMYILWYESISSHDDVRIRLAENHEAYRRDVERWLREGVEEGFIRPSIDPRMFAIQFVSFIFGTIYQWLVNPEAIDLHQTFQDYRLNTLETLLKRHVD